MLQMSENQHRDWCFTYNNYTEEGERQVKEYRCEYLVYGREIGDSGTPHLQGYIEFKSPKRLATLKKQLPKEIHWELRKGTKKQAADYCKEDGDFFEKGEMTRQGERTDLHRVNELVEEKATLATIAEECPTEFIKYQRGITALRNLRVLKPRSGPAICVWLWGKTGVGKTRFPFDTHNTVYIKDGTMWWDGYDQQEAIVVDDYDGKWPFRNFLQFLDRYPFQGQVKGGYVNINSPYIYVTCEFPPSSLYSGTELAQVERRLTGIFHFQ